MKDVYESIKEHLTERFSSPLFGAFSMSWLAWNHTYLFILFSDTPIVDRIALTKSALFPTVEAVALRGVIYPFVSAVGFILIYPHISKVFFIYWHKRQMEIANKRKEIDGLTMVTIEESNAMRKDMLSNWAEYQKSLREKDTEIATLKSEIELSKTANSIKNIIIAPPKEESKMEVDEGVIKLISFLIKKDGEWFTESIRVQMKEPKVRIDHYIDNAIGLGYVENATKWQEGAFHPSLKLTPAGRSFAIQAKLVN